MVKIKQGDVFIFEAGNDWVGKSIAFLTKSNVSHAAMVYRDNAIVEMGASGINVNPFRVDSSGSKVYHLRLQPEHDPSPLLKAADQYIQSEIKYDFSSLVLLAGLLIYRDVRPTPRWQKITDMIIGQACVALDKLLNRIIHKSNEKVMMCSQLVYQCYADCGKDYHIKLKNGLLETNEANVSSDFQSISNDGTICIFDLLDNNMDRVANESNSLAAVPEEMDVEQLAKELYESLEEASEVENDLLLTANDMVAIPAKAREFLNLLERILEKAAIDIPVASLFVTPADLLEHAENLEQLGVVQVLRK